MKFRMLWACLLLPVWVLAAPIFNLPTDVTQPDGSVLHCLASGDEYYNYLHDANGYTIIQDAITGWYCYAQSQRGAVVASSYRVGTVNPSSVGLTPHVRISDAEYQRRAATMFPNPRPNVRSPQTGTVNNIAVYIRFSDQTEFDTPRSDYDAKFNDVSEGAYSLCDFYHEASYNQLNLVTWHYPTCEPTVNLSYQDSHDRNYFVPYNATTNPEGYRNDDERTMREHTLLADAVTAIADQVPADVNVDADNDGAVDNVCFIIRGPHTAWASLLWAHRWALYAASAYIHGAQVWDFTFEPENQVGVNVLCHEMFHSIGAPDLYHYTFNGMTPAGPWDLMESGMGEMCVPMKVIYGTWIQNVPVLSEAGHYSLRPSTSSTGQVYRINSDNDSEYFLLEYRKQAGTYESNLPNSGLLVWRVDPTLSGNSDGPPDGIYVYRPGGTSELNGHIANATFSSDHYRTAFGAETDPTPWMNNGSASFCIYNVSAAGDSISFDFDPTGTLISPIVHFTSPEESDVIDSATINLSVSLTDPLGQTQRIDFYDNDVLLGSINTPTESFTWDTTPGVHYLRAVAVSSMGNDGVEQIDVTVLDTTHGNWFDWLSEDPHYSAWGRGSIDVTFAVDFDLGDIEFDVDSIAVNLAADPWGQPDVPGEFHASVVQFDNVPTDNVVADLGDFISPMTGRYTAQIDNPPVISGHVALVIHAYSYQNMEFDLNGVCGHSWITETDRPWMDALARGAQGSADISLLLRKHGIGVGNGTQPVAALTMTSYPNPFNPTASISFSLPEAGKATVAIYNLRGQLVRTLADSRFTAGNHSLTWNGRDANDQPVASGIYFSRLTTQNGAVVRKMMLMK